MTDWSLHDHFRQGLSVIDEIHASPRFHEFKPRVCFHFAPRQLSDDEPWSDEASFCIRAKPHFEALKDPLKVDYVGGTSGIEALEYVMPDADWLRKRIPEMLEVADKADIHFDGWSFEPIEPRDAAYLSSGPTLQVFNAHSPEGAAAMQELQRETSQTDDAN